MADGNYMRLRRKRLMDKDPFCHWCRRPLRMYEKAPNVGSSNLYVVDGKLVGKMPADYATIDHLTSRFFGRRKDVAMKEQTLVLACPACNVRRSNEELAAHPWRARWKAASLPRPFRWVNIILRKSRKWRKRMNYWGMEWTRRNLLKIARRIFKWTISWFVYVPEWCKECGNETHGYTEPMWVTKAIQKVTGKRRRLCFGCLRGLCKKHSISLEWAVSHEMEQKLPDRFSHSFLGIPVFEDASLKPDEWHLSSNKRV